MPFYLDKEIPSPIIPSSPVHWQGEFQICGFLRGERERPSPHSFVRGPDVYMLDDDNINIIANAASDERGTTPTAYCNLPRTSGDGLRIHAVADHHPEREEDITHHSSGRDITRPDVTSRQSIHSRSYVDSGLGFEHDPRSMETLRLAYVPLRRSLLCAMNEEVGIDPRWTVGPGTLVDADGRSFAIADIKTFEESNVDTVPMVNIRVSSGSNPSISPPREERNADRTNPSPPSRKVTTSSLTLPECHTSPETRLDAVLLEDETMTDSPRPTPRQKRKRVSMDDDDDEWRPVKRPSKKNSTRLRSGDPHSGSMRGGSQSGGELSLDNMSMEQTPETDFPPLFPGARKTGWDQSPRRDSPANENTSAHCAISRRSESDDVAKAVKKREWKVGNYKRSASHRIKRRIPKEPPSDMVQCMLPNCRLVLRNDRKSLESHLKTVHKATNQITGPITCLWLVKNNEGEYTECGEALASYPSFSRHVGSVHLNIRNAECPGCGVSCRADTLARHRSACRMCPVCQEYIAKSRSMEKHMKGCGGGPMNG